MNQFKTKVAQAFGDALRETRGRAGLSQEALAFESGVDRTFVSMLERGIRQPALATVFALSSALSVRPGVLVDRAAALAEGRVAKR